MRIATSLTLAAFALSSLALPARADLVGKTVDPAEAATRGGDGGAQVDSFFDDVGNFFSNDVAHVVTHNILPVGKFIGKGITGQHINNGDVDGFVNGLTTSQSQVDEAGQD
jgi:hypothetical protein